VYDPNNPNYIYKEIRKTKLMWNEKQLSFFGYNGNYPEVIRNALEKRGNWKVLQYNEMCALQVKQKVASSPYFKRKHS
jgi:hypothetical protein